MMADDDYSIADFYISLYVYILEAKKKSKVQFPQCFII